MPAFSPFGTLTFLRLRRGADILRAIAFPNAGTIYDLREANYDLENAFAVLTFSNFLTQGKTPV